ncbi:MAG: hypothetical protein AABX24_01455 [Nanoarchaeota archaeon]
MISPTQEQPIYAVQESKQRTLIPKITTLLFLAAIFYLGVLVNISLLELSAEQETILKTGSLLTLAVIILIGTILTFRKTRQPYLFYKNRITHGKETIYYFNITNTTATKNHLDRSFKTYSLQLGKTFVLRNIPETIQLSNYIQQLIEYAKKNQ